MSATPHEIALNMAVWFFGIPLFFAGLALIERFIEWKANRHGKK